jgi:hypothetical protein
MTKVHPKPTLHKKNSGSITNPSKYPTSISLGEKTHITEDSRK